MVAPKKSKEKGGRREPNDKLIKQDNKLTTKEEGNHQDQGEMRPGPPTSMSRSEKFRII
jgi:hypothetical protein